MHDQAMAWVAQYSSKSYDITVLDIGGRNINGTVKDLFPNCEFVTLDNIDDDIRVDIVADAATWEPDREYDIVTCTEVFEHAEEWKLICLTAFQALRSGGSFIATCAGPGRPEHSAYDGGWKLLRGEYYGNVSAQELEECLTGIGFKDITVDQTTSAPYDTRAYAHKP